nr:hypothetical protein [Tanacetum cinerariifolium]
MENSPWVGKALRSDQRSQSKCTCSSFGWHILKTSYKGAEVVKERRSLSRKFKIGSKFKSRSFGELNLGYLGASRVQLVQRPSWIPPQPPLVEAADTIMQTNKSPYEKEQQVMITSWRVQQRDRLLLNTECGNMGIKGVEYFPNPDPRTRPWQRESYDNDIQFDDSCFGIFEFPESSHPDLGLNKVLQPITNGDLLIYDVNNHYLEMETYVERLELLDRGIPCGETRLLLVEKCRIRQPTTMVI